MVKGVSWEDEIAQYRLLVGHVEWLWKDAVRLFFTGRYASALFFAIGTLEETGKVGVARFQILINEQRRRRGLDPPQPERFRRGHPFYSHPKKHLLAAGAGAVVHARLDRLLGENAVIDFLEDVQAGRVKGLRQGALYADHDGRSLHLPAEAMSEAEAEHYLVLARELMGEVLGFEPEEWE